MNRLLSTLLWLLVALAGAGAYAAIALNRGDDLNSSSILIAALCTYAIGYRFYSKWIAAKVLVLDDRRATPAEVHEDGKDFVKTNKWIAFGHHFAAISGPGPLVGPVLAAQFGYLPATLWILIGVVLGGAVQDFVILFASMRRDGKSLGQMLKEELNPATGFVALVAILSIIVILLAVLALVVARALAESPWGVFTVAATIPIAMFMGGYLRFVRVGRVLEASVIGVVMLLAAVWGGKFIHHDATLAALFSVKAEPIAWAIIGYGLAASVLPVWLLLAPRDYLSTFMKLGTIFALAVGMLIVLPDLRMPAITRFIDGSGLVFGGKLFPFCFITIACGAISGFHSLISSGTTPKLITREGHARSIGYGAMCLESTVAIIALIAACTLEPGVYLAMNVKGVPAETLSLVNSLGFPVTDAQMTELATLAGENTLYGRTGGATTFAIGMATVFSKVLGGRGLDLWYHFAIMFEALFILTTIDAGTRVGRYLLQDLLRGVWKPLGNTADVRANLVSSLLLVSGWGYFLIQGVRDPLGGINSLWPLFGVANQLLAGIALCLGTTVILKMQLQKERPRLRYALVTLVPLAWVLTVTLSAGYQKIADSDPRVGFMAQVAALKAKEPGLREAALTGGAPATKALEANLAMQFNNKVDAVVAAGLMGLEVLIVVLSVREWMLLLVRRKVATLCEAVPVYRSGAGAGGEKPLNALGLISLLFLLARELSGEAAIDRVQQEALAVQNGRAPLQCASTPLERADDFLAMDVEQWFSKASEAAPLNRQEAYLLMTKRRFGGGVNRCC